MNILMIGHGKGSLEVRGRQLGGALGARVVTVPSDDDVRWADVVVLIKRAGQAWATYVQGFKKPIVWDALDFWEQPQQNGLSEQESKALLHATIKRIRPALVIGATEAMAREAHGVYLPHHSREGLTPAPAREVVSVVGCLCTPLDRLADKVALPKADVGDVIAIFMAGAYGMTASPSAFLGHPLPKEIMVDHRFVS